jgi:hypothetical protein
MNFKALKNFWLAKDKKTGRVRSYSKADGLELGPDDLQTIDELIMNLLITPTDSGLVPDVSRYKVLYQFQQEINGETVKGLRGDELKLPRDQAVNLMARGYIRPLDKDAWFPNKPGFMPDKPAKKMYDGE